VPKANRIAFVAEQAARWVRLGAKPPSERKVAIVLSNYPNRDGRVANGVGLDTPESAVRLVAAMRGTGYEAEGFPESATALMDALLAGPTNALRRSPVFEEPAPRPPAALPRRKPGPMQQTERGRTVADLGIAGVAGEEGSDLHAVRMGRGFRRGSEEGDEGPGKRGPPSAQGDVVLSLPLEAYRNFFSRLPIASRHAIVERWGEPEEDPHVVGGAFRLAVHRFGNLVVGIQPARGYNIDPKATYHDPDLVPPHHYLAFYAWLRESFDADAIVHLGKHGNLEWLPGKAAGLSAECWPEVALGATPLIYPFIVNDPGEGAQAKRRASTVIVDHLMPALTRAEIHGPLAELETLIDEYALAAGVDARRRAHLQREIFVRAATAGLDRDLGLGEDDTGEALRKLDAHLCEIKEMQIRDGLHVLGTSPSGRARTDTLVAIARVPRSGGRAEDASLHRAIAEDLGLRLDPLDCDLSVEWAGPRPDALAQISTAPWRTNGDTVERIELLAALLVASSGSVSHSIVADASFTSPRRGKGEEPHPVSKERSVGPRSEAVLRWIAEELAPALDRSGAAETAAVLAALDGRFVPPGPSGAPSRGRPEVLPTGRNFYSVDIRGVPTEAAWTIGRAAADALALRYFQDAGEWPRSIAISAWGTSNMRTGGDDIAQVLALIGARPVWEAGTGRVTGFTVLSLAELGRPRIDVTFRISGMFRDAFPQQIDLIDSAVRAVAELGEPADANPVAVRVGAESRRLMAAGVDPALARRRAGTSVFGSKPGAYGAGMQALIDEGVWSTRSDFAEAYLAWGGFAYGAGEEGAEAAEQLSGRLKATDAVLQNQDNREHDILDSDDYYQFQGGLAATVETLKGSAPRVYHGDTSRPEKPVVRSLGEEIARVVRGRAANPKWIAGVMRHGYKGAFEMAATVDYLFAYAATTDAVRDHHFDLLYAAYLGDEAVAGFIGGANAPALAEMAARFREAIDRGLWRPASNAAYGHLTQLIAGRSVRPKEAAE
jgi:cobaltochelatase CobN